MLLLLFKKANAVNFGTVHFILFLMDFFHLSEQALPYVIFQPQALELCAAVRLQATSNYILFYPCCHIWSFSRWTKLSYHGLKYVLSFLLLAESCSCIWGYAEGSMDLQVGNFICDYYYICYFYYYFWWHDLNSLKTEANNRKSDHSSFYSKVVYTLVSFLNVFILWDVNASSSSSTLNKWKTLLIWSYILINKQAKRSHFAFET